MKHLLMLLALGGLGASCSNDDLVDGNNVVTNGRTEIQIAFSGTGENQEYTRAIATPSENEIKTLKIYLFAAADEAGPYYFLEEWTEGIAYVPGNPNGTNFVKQESGGGYKATLYPNELKGLPWVKLMCVANNGITADGTPGGTTDGKFYEENGTTEQPAWVKVTTDPATGAVTNAGTATTETVFRTAYTAALGTDVPTGVIATPLLMTGVGVTKISGSVSKVSIDLKRIVARFDIENKTSSSSLTITSVHMAQGRINGSLWGVTPVENAALLTAYQPRTFTATDGINLGLGENAIYTYPGAVADESYLVIVGTYKSPVTSEQVPVTYNIPVVRTPEGAQPGTPGTYLQLKPNSRYKLRITDVSQSNVFGTFEVVDWTSGGGINVRPENSAPVFVGDEAFTGANLPTNLNPDPNHAPPYNYEVNGDAGTFSIEIGATGKVRAEKTEVATRALANDWMTIGNPTTEERDGVWYSTFNITYANAVGQQPIAVRFINETASFDPSLWTVVNFYGPKAKPAFAVVADGNSKGNKTDATDPSAPTAAIYSVVGGFVQFTATCIEGIKVDAAPAGYKLEEVKKEGFVYTYKVSVIDAATADGGTIVFKNTGDETKTSTLTLNKEDPTMTVAETAGTGVSFHTTGQMNVDLDVFTTYTLRINTPQGLTATNLDACVWLSFAADHIWSEAEPYVTYTVTPKATPANTNDYDLTFTNNLAESGITAPGLTLKVHKDFSKPKLSAGTTTAEWSTFNVGLTSNFTDTYNATIELYKVVGSKATVKMACGEEAAEFATATGLKVTQVGVTDEYTIEVEALAGLATELIAENKEAGAGADRKATLTIKWKEAGIKVALATNTLVEESKQGDDIVYTIDAGNLPAGGFTFTVTAPGGATTDLSGLTGTFLVPHNSSTGTNNVAAGIPSTYQFKVDDDTAAETELTFTNAITGGGDQKIIFKKK